jgi:hypothetical protein
MGGSPMAHSAIDSIIGTARRIFLLRQSRRIPGGRIPQGLWAHAVALTATLSVTGVESMRNRKPG